MDNPKFKGFYEIIRGAKADGVDVVTIHHPEVLGDDYNELVENLNLLANSGLMLLIVPMEARAGRGKSRG